MASKYALETVFKLIDQVTQPLDRIGLKGAAVGKSLKREIFRTEEQLAALGKAAVKAGAKMLAAGTAAIGAWAGKGVKDAMDFHSALTKISTVADLTTVSMDDLSAGLRRISNETGVAVSELAAMQYEAISSGIATADSVDFLASAVKASKTGFVDTSTAISALTSITSAYGLSASDADRITGQFLVTQNMGRTSFQDLANGIGNVLPTASRLNIQSEELFASITALTAKGGFETPKAMKALQGAMKAVINPSKDASGMAKRLGIDFSEAALKSKGFIGFIKDIQNKTGGSVDKLQELFGSIDAANAIITLTGKGAGDFAAAIAAMGDSAGIAESSFKKMMSTPQERLNAMLNKVRNTGINMGLALLPVVERLMDRVGEFADRVAEIDFDPIAESLSGLFNFVFNFMEALFKTIGTLWQLRGVLLALLSVYGIYKLFLIGLIIQEKILDFQLKLKKISTIAVTVAQKAAVAGTKLWAIAQMALNAAFVASPIGLVILAITALIAIIVICVKNWDTITDAMSRAWEWIKKVATIIWEGLVGAFQTVADWIGRNSEKVMTLITIFTGPFGLIISIVKELKDSWGAVVEAFRSDGILGAIKRIGGVILSAVLAPIQGLLEILAKIPGAGKLLDPAVNKLQEVRNTLKGIDEPVTQAAAISPGMAGATRQPITPMNQAQQQAIYSRSESQESVDIYVKPEQGAAARMGARPAPSANVKIRAAGVY